MKTIRIIIAIAASAFAAGADEVAGPYDAGRFSLEPFAAVRLTEFSKTTAQWGGGVALGYQLKKNVGAQLSVLSYGLTDRPVIESVDEISADLKAYLPLGSSGLAPFGILGYTRDHAQDANMLDAGLGVGLRGGRFQAEAFAKVQTDFHRRSARLLIGASVGVGF